jgi:RNA polymerase sigma-70 factor, ECF subfamily
MSVTCLVQEAARKSSPLAKSASDFDLIIALRDRQVNALSQIYDRYSASVYDLAYKILQNSEEAEDITHDIFLKLWDRQNYDPSRGSLKTFLILMTRSQSIDRLRSRNCRFKVLQRWQTVLWGNSTSIPLDYALAGERSEHIQGLLDRLPIYQRQVLEIIYYEGLTQAEAAQRLNIPLGTVKTRSRQALFKLQRVLKEG